MQPYQRGLRVGLSVSLLTWSFGTPTAIAQGRGAGGVGAQTDNAPKITNATNSKKTVAPKTDPIQDLMPVPPTVFHSSVVTVSDVPGTGNILKMNTDINHIEQRQKFSWKEGDLGLVGVVGGTTQYDPNNKPVKVGNFLQVVDSHMNSASNCKVDDATQLYVFHITHWTAPKITLASQPEGKPKINQTPPISGAAEMQNSRWYAYTLDRHNHLHFARLVGSNNQSVYGKRNALIVGLAMFDEKEDDSSFAALNEIYSVSEVQGTPQNSTDLRTLASAILPFVGNAQSEVLLTYTAGQPPLPPEKFVLSVGCQLATAKLPYTLTVTDSTVAKASDPPTADAPAAGAFKCQGTDQTIPCASTRAIGSVDKEYWDVSVGIAVPGVRETKPTFASNTVTTSATTHTDLYAFADFYWAAHWKPKDSIVPHPFLGLPVTSQTFYRPLFGMSENVTGWTRIGKKLSLPSVNVFAGMVDMKTHYLVGTPTTQAAFNTDLKTTRVWKPVFGVDVPISSMASKLGKKGSAAPAKSTTGAGGF